MNDHIRHDREDLLESLLGGKSPRNLSWSAVVDLIGQVGEVQPRRNDERAFVVGQQRAVFERPSDHNLEVENVSRLRRRMFSSAFSFSRRSTRAVSHPVRAITVNPRNTATRKHLICLSPRCFHRGLKLHGHSLILTFTTHYLRFTVCKKYFPPGGTIIDTRYPHVLIYKLL